jgi:hypothetical protein
LFFLFQNVNPIGKQLLLTIFAFHQINKDFTYLLLGGIFKIIFLMGMNKNTVLAWATFIMILVGLGLMALGAFKYNDVAGWGFASVGIGFFAIAWVFNALKGRV